MTTTPGSGRLWRLAPWVLAALLLLVPAIGMQVSAGWSWNAADFAVAGAVLFGACGAYQLTARTSSDPAYRAGMGAALLAAIMLIWISLAVGIIGSEDHPANRMYAGLLMVALIGALLVRFRAGGMAWVLCATAFMQIATGGLALIAGWGSAGGNGAWPVAFLTGCFVALWLLSAWLFRKAAWRQKARAAAP